VAFDNLDIPAAIRDLPFAMFISVGIEVPGIMWGFRAAHRDCFLCVVAGACPEPETSSPAEKKVPFGGVDSSCGLRTAAIMLNGVKTSSEFCQEMAQGSGNFDVCATFRHNFAVETV